MIICDPSFVNIVFLVKIETATLFASSFLNIFFPLYSDPPQPKNNKQSGL